MPDSVPITALARSRARASAQAREHKHTPPTEEERAAVEAVALLEAHEPLVTVRKDHLGPDGKHVPGGGQNLIAAWMTWLDAHAVVPTVAGQKFRNVRVPSWVNALLDVLGASAVAVESSGARTLKLVKRAFRSCARSANFRAALSAEIHRLRTGPAQSRTPAEDLRAWLYTFNWESLRPAGTEKPEGSPKTPDAALDTGEGLP